MADETALEEYFDDLRGDKVWPTGPAENARLVVEDQNLLTTPKAHAVEEGGRCVHGPSVQTVTVNQTVLFSVRSKAKRILHVENSSGRRHPAHVPAGHSELGLLHVCLEGRPHPLRPPEGCFCVK